jgi:NADH:ubiquinone oxidoreductase subunit D
VSIWRRHGLQTGYTSAYVFAVALELGLSSSSVEPAGEHVIRVETEEVIVVNNFILSVAHCARGLGLATSLLVAARAAF